MARKRDQGDRIRKFRSDVAKLKRAGLVSSEVDARRAQPSKAMRAKIRKYKDVISGDAVVVKARSARAAKVASGRAGGAKAGFVSVGDKVIVPRHKGMKAYYEGGYIQARGRTFGQKVHQVYVTPAQLEKVKPARKGFYYTYKVPFVQFDRFQTFSDYQAYADFRNDYHKKGQYLDMDEQVILEEVPEGWEPSDDDL